LSGHTHTLAVSRVEAADRVTEREQPAREFREPVEMSPETGGKPKANNLAKLLRFVDGVVNGGSTQPLRVSEKTVAIARRLFAVTPPTALGRLVFQMFGALAEFERSLIRECTQAGLVAARRAQAARKNVHQNSPKH
jgi:hypothetical protein